MEKIRRINWPSSVRATVRAIRPVLRGIKDPEAVRLGSWNYGMLVREPITKVFPGIEHTSVSLLRTFDRKVGMSLDANELLMLVAIARHLEARRVIEVGTFDGNTTLNLAANLGPEGLVMTIDVPPGWKGQYRLSGGTGMADNSLNRLTEFFRNQGYDPTTGRQFRGHEYESRVKQIYADSAALDWSTLAPADLVFIDGNHSYEYVKSDTEHAIDVLAPHGVIVWHDYGMIPTVSRCVDEVADRLHVHALSGSRFAVGSK